jgi:hypothetical protein
VDGEEEGAGGVARVDGRGDLRTGGDGGIDPEGVGACTDEEGEPQAEEEKRASQTVDGVTKVVRHGPYYSLSFLCENTQLVGSPLRHRAMG